jgi:aminodeoxychorismate synthase component I
MNILFAPAATRCRKLVAGTGRPFWRSVEMYPPQADVFLLDSSLADGRLGRWSFAGGRPLATLSGRRRPGADGGLALELTVWREPDGSAPAQPRVVAFDGDPYEALRTLRAAYRPQADHEVETSPFGGGLVGWFGYGTAWATERLPRRPDRDEPDAPDLLFLVFDDVLRHDHATGETTLALIGRGPDDPAAARDLDSRAAEWEHRLRKFAAAAPPGEVDADAGGAPSCARPADLSGVVAACDEEAYRAAVARCREHILAGDAFEICLTQQLAAPLRTEPWTLYRALRGINPAPFAAFVRSGGIAVAGASPERFLSLDADGRLESRPIKGTRPRGASPAEDQRLREELRDSEKDGAENLMIVDLVRSDLGRVARIGSVTVPELKAIETYATVHQMVSTIRADLRPDRDALDAVRACFPGGSMTGAPKLEAMAIIDALEPAPRGVYAGALGWLGYDGAMDLSIVIRTFVCADGKAAFGVGGAVTADSEPGAEYRETLDKARALLAALRRAPSSIAEASDEGDRS